MMDLAMMGCGTGAIIEPYLIDRLLMVRNTLKVLSVSDIGITAAGQRQDHCTHTIEGNRVQIAGDTRRGWVDSYQLMLELSGDPRFNGETAEIDVDPTTFVRWRDPERLRRHGQPREAERPLRPGGPTAEQSHRRRLTSVECCLLIDEAAVTIVAGNIRRSAGMRQFAADTARPRPPRTTSGNRMRTATGASTRTGCPAHGAPACTTRRARRQAGRGDQAVPPGEGAIQFAPEAIARSNADLLSTPELRSEFIEITAIRARRKPVAGSAPTTTDRPRSWSIASAATASIPAARLGS